MTRVAARETAIEVLTVGDAATREAAQALVAEYLRWIADEAGARYGLSFDVDAMVASDVDDRAKFYPPDGRFYVVRDAGQYVGIGCLRRLGPDACELQRMYVQPRARRLGVARQLALRLLADARAIGYRSVRLESLKFLSAAHALYRSLGFEEVEPDAGDTQHDQPWNAPDTYRSSVVCMEMPL